jgi:FkbM family methyltransferase
MDNPIRSSSELARRLVRSFTPRRAYLSLSSAFDWSRAIQKLGWRQSRRLWRIHPRHNRTDAGIWLRMTSPNLLYPLYLRPGSTDVDEFLYTVVRESYGRYLPKGEVSFIMDAGANIGDTAAWLLTRFPQAKLIAVEPDLENFTILQRNCAPYRERSLPERAAVWPCATRLSLNGNQAKDAVEVREAIDGECLGMTVASLMAKHGFPRLDILKCDIEGAERHLFSQNADEWLANTSFIVVETHGTECLDAVLYATAPYGFIHSEFRNLHIFELDRS